MNSVELLKVLVGFDTTSREKQAVAQYTKSAAVYGRLHALGADAFRLYARLPQLEQVPDMRIYGATGALHMLSDRRIEREQQAAEAARVELATARLKIEAQAEASMALMARPLTVQLQHTPVLCWRWPLI